MKRLRVAIIGARGIGRFHVREFLHTGAEVVAIVGTSIESVTETAQGLKEFGITPLVFTNLDDLIASESIDAVSICSPQEYHYDMVKKCLLANLHVLCEKPFVHTGDHDNVKHAIELVNLAQEKKRIISVNTQWPSVLPACSSFVDLGAVTHFYMYMQPLSTGKEMLFEQISHMNSMLVAFLPLGNVKNITFSHDGVDQIDVKFMYYTAAISCDVHYKFKHKKERPRDFIFSINGVQFERKISETYHQTLSTGDSSINIEDPFKVSVGMFVAAIEKAGVPLITGQQIIENMSIQDQIIQEYNESFK